MKTFKMIASVAIAALAGAGVYASVDNNQFSDLQMENIVALTQEGDNPYAQTNCSRAIAWCTCKRNKQFVCMTITAVQTYSTVSCVELCSHDRVSSCPSGTSCY